MPVAPNASVVDGDAGLAYAEKQTRLLALLSQSRELIRDVYRASPDDRFALQYSSLVHEGFSIEIDFLCRRHHQSLQHRTRPSLCVF